VEDDAHLDADGRRPGPRWVTDVENVDRPARSRARIAGKVRLAVHDRYAVAGLWIS